MTKNRQIESMVRFSYEPFTVRIWREAPSITTAVNDESPLMPPAGLSMGRLAEWIAGQPSVAAVEVLDGNGKGVLIYPDWK